MCCAPLIHMQWQEGEPAPPTWHTWAAMAHASDPSFSASHALDGLSFREELHAIEAVIGGQGVGMCSDVLVARELQVGALVKISDLSLPGFGFFAAHVPGHACELDIVAFADWVAGQVRSGA